MEVTRENFDEVFCLIEESIKTADFIAFDIEFSGKVTKWALRKYLLNVNVLSRYLYAFTNRTYRVRQSRRPIPKGQGSSVGICSDLDRSLYLHMARDGARVSSKAI